jgi:hypothetical protein
VYCASIEGHSDKQTYERRKKYVELFLAKVVSPQVCYMFKNGESIDIFSNKNVGEVLSAVESGYSKPIAFFSKWDKDPHQRRYNKSDFIPFNADLETIDNTTYNLFQGFNKHIHHPFEDQDKLLKPFLDLVTALCEDNEDFALFFLYFIASIVQEPRKRPPITFTFKGKQGTGKNVILATIGRLIGMDHYTSSSKPEDFFGPHAEGFYRKLLVNVNECEGKKTFNMEGQMKSFVTEDKIVVNPKFMRPMEVSNYACLIYTTNQPNPFTIDTKSGDRRNCVFTTSNKYLKYAGSYWSKLVAHMSTPQFYGALYEYLMSLDYSKVDWIKDRPITTAYKQMCQANSPTEALFFEEYLIKYDLYTSSSEYRILMRQMYSSYKDFCTENNFYKGGVHIPTSRAFKTKLTELGLPIVENRMKKGMGWVFTPCKVYSHLLEMGWVGDEIPERGDGEDPFDEEYK